ncbi:hypothetical protein QBC33DRAFT_619924 [Phialemonium atrogriseum]|uniref:Uncharacterized protein n=1 Tax=Phialemonium atrogriseum TaxID=1093897 RepID=A0AAJ0BZ74_9PEZI|nr:uncharacterized protein QBC33DRAFT_619924 [Phialemonium atrogriseum]KAK1767228.1 hypothetical protein QBC33DRAFT_619924 [Phialemonium atrogriseum]
MFQPTDPRVEPTAYEYNRQAIEDIDDRQSAVQGFQKRAHLRGKKPNYRPTPLRWPFILTLIFLICVAIGLVVWAEKAMPNSDSTAIVDHPGTPPRMKPRLWHGVRRDNTSAPSTTLNQETALSAADPVSMTDSIQAPSLLSSVLSLETSPSISASVISSQITASNLLSTLTSPSVAPATSTVAPSSTSVPRETQPPPSNTLSPEASPSSMSSPSRTGASAPLAVTTSSSSRLEAGVQLSDEKSSARIPVKESTSTPPTSSPQTTPLKATGIYIISGSSTISTVDPLSVSRLLGPSFTLSTSTSLHTSTIIRTSTRTTEITSIVTAPPSTTAFNTTSLSFITTFSTTTMTITHSGSTFSTVETLTTELPVTQTIAPSFTEGTSVVSTFLTASTIVRTSFGTATGSIETSVGTVPVTSTVTATFSTTLVAPVVTEVQTVIVPYSQTPDPKTGAPVNVVVTITEGGEVHNVVQTFAPQTKVIEENGGVRTQVYTPPPQTVVTSIGGTPTANVMVFTPSAVAGKVSVNVVSTFGGQTVTLVNTQGLQTIVTSQGGGLVTLVTAPPPQTQVQIIGGTVTTIGVVSIQADGQATSANVVTTIGGTPVTVVNSQGPQTIVTSSGGSLVTLVTTPPPETEVTVVGGTLTTVELASATTSFQPISYTVTTDIGGTRTTEVMVTTPTASDLITITLDSSIVGGTVTTVVQTFEPSTVVTEIAGTLTTIVSTPAPSTMLSTAPKSTITRTATSTPSDTPTATMSGGPTSVTSLIVTVKAYNLTAGDYFIGTFLPTFLAVMLVIPLRTIDLNAKLYQPFNALASSPRGAPGPESMTLQYTGLAGLLTPLATLLHGRPVPFITTLAVACASLAVPLAAEAVGLKMHGHCREASAEHCAAALGVSPAAATALVAVLACVALLMVVLVVLLLRWPTGVASNPWTVAGMAALVRNPDVAAGLFRRRDDAGLRRAVADRRYGIGYFEGRDGGEEYGIVLLDESGRGLAAESGRDDDEEEEVVVVWPPQTEGATAVAVGKNGRGRRRRREKELPFMTLRYPWRIAFLLYIVGLLVLILYYHLTLRNLNSDFNRFMYSHSFGVRFLFAILGVIVTSCWQAFFIAVTTMAPYQLLATHSDSPPQQALHLPRPTNPISAITSSTLRLLRHRHHRPQLFPLATATAALLAEFLPALLSNVPYSPSQTLRSHDACAALSAATLVCLAWCLVASLLPPRVGGQRWPRMPVDPRLMEMISEIVGIIV